MGRTSPGRMRRHDTVRTRVALGLATLPDAVVLRGVRGLGTDTGVGFGLEGALAEGVISK
jgi:hypothetical protein